MTNAPRHSVSVAAVITDDHGRVLVTQRRDNGKWEPPGGILELEETIEDGLRREVREETGVEINPGRLTGVYKNTKLGVVALVFRTTISHGVPGPTDETQACEWWTPEQVTEHMAETFAIRIHDALSKGRPAVRAHDGTHIATSSGFVESRSRPRAAQSGR
ncbi:MAG TPA: NUDIX hydrolase [Micromonosporaceae bacterium]